MAFDGVSLLISDGASGAPRHSGPPGHYTPPHSRVYQPWWYKTGFQQKIDVESRFCTTMVDMENQSLYYGVVRTGNDGAT
jgi:hypothetical protein